jgi:hypothetical protein
LKPRYIEAADLFSDYYDQAKDLGQRTNFLATLFDSLCENNCNGHTNIEDVIFKIREAGETCMD